MFKLFKAEYYKLPKSSVFTLIILSVIIAEIIATGLFFYNIKFSNTTPTVNIYLIYCISWFTPVFYLLFGVLTSYILSTEYENNMWSVLLVSDQNKVRVVFNKYIVALILSIVIIIVFAIVHMIFSMLIVGHLPNLISYLYILVSFLIGSLAMQSIQFFLGLAIPNRVYIIGVSLVISILYILVQSYWIPFKIPEHLINSKNILNTNRITMFDVGFIIYSIYSLLVFLFINALTCLYTKRKDF
ncbi:ABC transporter permease [Staphylococcus marylandisciuri]|uniref:ABC transporter permease n=1 Tax=Staphylococcus marylandisciuri TaxID=2981529 RepID=UPI0035713AB9